MGLRWEVCFDWEKGKGGGERGFYCCVDDGLGVAFFPRWSGHGFGGEKCDLDFVRNPGSGHGVCNKVLSCDGCAARIRLISDTIRSTCLSPRISRGRFGEHVLLRLMALISSFFEAQVSFVIRHSVASLVM